VTPLNCTTCRTELPPDVLACPACGVLVYSDTLKRLAADADAAAARGELAFARSLWTEMLPLLPAHSQQLAVIQQRVVDTPAQTASVGGETPRDTRSFWSRIAAGATATSVLLVGKLKFSSWG
jgi:hypothetical protein